MMNHILLKKVSIVGALIGGLVASVSTTSPYVSFGAEAHAGKAECNDRCMVKIQACNDGCRNSGKAGGSLSSCMDDCQKSSESCRKDCDANFK